LYEVSAGGEGDLAACAAIQAASPEAAQWPPRDYLRRQFLVARAGVEVVGFLVAQRLVEGESEILNLAVAPAFRRAGVARALVGHWTTRNPGTVFLEVRASNTPARCFYQSLCFQEVGERCGYYENPPETAIVMKFRSC
jgi:[ribosomal protein S18]-alanine N-acetyltransferase